MEAQLQALNERQREAVVYKDGPLLVLAGAGSGKTRVLTTRISYLIHHGVSAANILAVTFTNKAAGEMKERIAELLSVPYDQSRSLFTSHKLPFVGTFHSLCVQILRREAANVGYSANFVIYDSDDQLSVVKRVMKEMSIDKKEANPYAVKHMISSAKNELQTPEVMARMADDYFGETAAKIYKRYQEILKDSDAFDFDDLIGEVLSILKKNEKILERYQERFRYILVDEYQDTNKAQYELVKLLASKYRNLCVVGDDWQSIYGWRGADVRNILDFEKDYPEAKVVKLEQNYRSTQNILDAAHHVMKESSEYRDKELWTEQGSGECISRFVARNAYGEAEFVARKVLEAKNVGKRYDQMAILYRTNVQSRIFEEILLKHGIPYKIVGGVRFYDRKEIKDVLAYLRLLTNPSDSQAFLRVVNYPTRKIGAKSVTVVQDEAQKRGISYLQLIQDDAFVDTIRGGAKKGLRDFRSIFERAQEKMTEFTLAELIEYVSNTSGIVDTIRDGSDEGENRYENVLELLSVAERFMRGDAKTDLEALLQEVSLLSDQDEMDNSSPFQAPQEKDELIMMTIHSAKGLEFDYVFLVGMEENLFPHSRSVFEPKELDEERRLCYVGMTRAKHRLFIVRAEERSIFGNFQSNVESRFTELLPENLVKDIGGGFAGSGVDSFSQASGFQENAIQLDDMGAASGGGVTALEDGDLVMHAAFGKGVVLRVLDNQYEIAFAKRGIKKIAKDFPKMRKIS